MGFSFFPSQLLPAKKIKCHYTDKDSLDCLSNNLSEFIKQQNRSIQNDLIVLCIGTDRSTGDCLGPLVGWLLSRRECKIPVYGTLDDPIHAGNLADKLTAVKKRHHNPLIIAVDACLGKLDSVGMITLGEGMIKPGAGVHKELPGIGNIYFTGIVNVAGHLEFVVLQNTRLSLVMRMASLIAECIELGIRKASVKN